MGSIRSWAFAPPINDGKFSGVGVPARHSTGLMVRRTHPTLSFGGTGFQPVRCTGKITVPPITFVSGCFWFPSSRLGTPLQAKLLLCERIIYLLRHVPQAGAWGKIYVPKQELGNEGKAKNAALSRLRASGLGLLMKRPVGPASSPARGGSHRLESLRDRKDFLGPGNKARLLPVGPRTGGSKDF